MKVSTLIERLQKFPQDADVRMNNYGGYPLLFVCSAKDNDDQIWLESEGDCDMVEEINARFQAAVEGNEDETDVYARMLEDGIDVEMVRHYLGDEQAEHMWQHCYDHGLF